MLRGKFIAFALLAVLVLAIGGPFAIASPTGSQHTSTVESVLAWFDQIGEYLGFRVVRGDPGALEDNVSSAHGVSTDGTGELAPSTGSDESPRSSNYGEEDPPPSDELGGFYEPGG